MDYGFFGIMDTIFPLMFGAVFLLIVGVMILALVRSASEWSSKAAPFVPAADLTVSLAVEGYGRAVQVEAHSNLGHEILRRWEAQWNGAV